MIYILLLLWIMCGVFAFGISVASDNRYHSVCSYRESVTFAFFMSLAGPLFLIPILATTGFPQRGLLYRKKTWDKRTGREI